MTVQVEYQNSNLMNDSKYLLKKDAETYCCEIKCKFARRSQLIF